MYYIFKFCLDPSTQSTQPITSTAQPSTTHSLSETSTPNTIATRKSTNELTEQSTLNLSIDTTTKKESSSDASNQVTETWVILVAAIPIFGGLIFLVGLAVWYNRRKRAKVWFCSELHKMFIAFRIWCSDFNWTTYVIIKLIQGNAENWKYNDKKSGRFSEVEMTPIIKNGNLKAGKTLNIVL